MIQRFKRGFTLIELLVVVAIIGILAGLVVVSVAGARTRANDAKVKSDISTIANAASLHLATNTTGLTTATDVALADSHTSQFKDDAGNSTMPKAPIYPGKSINDTTDGYIWTATASSYTVRGDLKVSGAGFFCGKDGATYQAATSAC